MSSLLTQIENVTAGRKADAEQAYNAALARAAIDPDVVAYLETLESAAEERRATPADVVRLEGVLDRLGRTISDFRHDVDVRQQVAKLRASLLTEEQQAALGAERQAAEDAVEQRLRQLGHDMIDRIPASDLNYALISMNLAANNCCRGYDAATVHHGVAPIMVKRDVEVRAVEEKLAQSRSNALRADRLERENPRAFPPAE